jgi:hypothetical protein
MTLNGSPIFRDPQITRSRLVIAGWLILRARNISLQGIPYFTIRSHYEPKDCGQIIDFGNRKNITDLDMLIAAVASLQLLQERQLEISLPNFQRPLAHWCFHRLICHACPPSDWPRSRRSCLCV